MSHFVLRQFRRLFVTFVLVFLVLSCAGVPKSPKSSDGAISGLKSFDEALSGAVTEIAAKVIPKTEIVVYRISGPVEHANEYISEELNGLLNSMSSLTVLAREDSLNALKAEQMYQMSGFVSDSSMVSIGNHLGAKVVVSGTLSMYESFSQLRLRAVDVETSALAASYDVRINSADPILKSISGSQIFTVNISENAVTHLNRGKDLLAVIYEMYSGELDELNKMSVELDKVIVEFDKALAINNDLAEAYFLRAQTYYEKFMVNVGIMLEDVDELELLQDSFIMSLFDKAIADLNQAIKLDTNYTEAYLSRSDFYTDRGMLFTDIADFHDENEDYITAESYYIKAENYFRMALADINQVIRPNSDDYLLFSQRGLLYRTLDEFDLAIPDYTKAIQLAPDVYWLYTGRGLSYMNIGDYNKALFDFETALRLNPNYYEVIGNQYEYAKQMLGYEAAPSLPQTPQPVAPPAETAQPPQTTARPAETTQPPKAAVTPPANTSASANSGYFYFYPFVGYNFLYDMPIGLTLGAMLETTSPRFFDFYASFNLSTDNKIGWSAGFSMTPFPYNEFFWLSAGVGANHAKNNDDEWENKFAIEIGPKFLFDIIYVSAYYRLIGFKESSFSVGAGVSFFLF